MERLLLEKHTDERTQQSDSDIGELSLVYRNTYPGFTPRAFGEQIYFQEMLCESIESEREHLQKRCPEINLIIRNEFRFFSETKLVRVLLTNLISNTFKYQGSDRSNAYVYIKVHTNSTGTNILIRNNNVSERKDAGAAGSFHYAKRQKSHEFGLELYIVKETIKKLKGHLEVDFQLEDGTEYKVYLPNLLQQQPLRML